MNRTQQKKLYKVVYFDKSTNEVFERWMCFSAQTWTELKEAKKYVEEIRNYVDYLFIVEIDIFNAGTYKIVL